MTWYKDSRPLDASSEPTYSGVIQNTLELGPLARADQGTAQLSPLVIQIQSSSILILLIL